MTPSRPDPTSDAEASASARAASLADPDLAAHVPVLTERLFRDEAGKLVATLTRHFGVAHLSLAEDVVQEAMVRALHLWPYRGIPENPSAWLTQVAKRLALDAIRREATFRGKEAEISASLEADSQSDPRHGSDEHDIRDDRLRLLFVCCHPHLAPEAQVALALKTLCGFGTLEISRAFLTTEAAIAKRLTRAKQRLRDDKIPFEIPTGTALRDRLDGVLQTLYLLFNEGYKASTGDQLIRNDVCDEAIRLTTFLVHHPAGDTPDVHALLALMLFNAARFDARQDADGNLLRLEDQDRRKWDGALIRRGWTHLARASAGGALGRLHLQAAIAACHCAAPTFASTDWRRILGLYDHLLALDNSPIVALNRTIALAQVEGPDAALRAIATIADRDKLENYHLYHAALADLEARRGGLSAAKAHYQRALDLAETRSERDFLSRRLSELG